MSKTLIGFTDDEISFAKSLIEFARTKLQERHDESHSGVDQLLIGGWLVSTSKLLEKFEETATYTDVVVSEEPEILQPEA
jgi:hypothetical protein